MCLARYFHEWKLSWLLKHHRLFVERGTLMYWVWLIDYLSTTSQTLEYLLIIFDVSF